MSPAMPTLSKFNARPEPLDVDLQKSAIVVVDMQNAFAIPGGMLDRAGFDIAGSPPVISAIAGVLAAARPAGIPIVYLQMAYTKDLSTGGGPESPNPLKETALSLMAR